MSTTHPPQALLFDVFGTVVDWRSTVTAALVARCTEALSAPDASLPSAVRLRASTLTAEDWATFAQQWRNSYLTFTRTHDPSSTSTSASASTSTSEFITIDAHHLASLHQLLDSWQLSGLWTSAQVREISLIWHHLTAWPDSVPGLHALNARFTTATLSNGNVSLLTDMAAYAGLPWTHVFSAEQFRAYKPSPRVYEGAAERLGLGTGRCAMVAAHLGDLWAARGVGMQTVYVERMGEEGWSGEEVERARGEGWVDMWVSLGDGGEEGGEGKGGFLEVARRLGVAGTGTGEGPGEGAEE